jgi:hypothetical protein
VTALLPSLDKGETASSRILGLLVTVIVAYVLVESFDLQLISNVFPSLGLDSSESRALTALLIGSGAAPAHEMMRYIEEKKNKAEREASTP